MYSYTQEQLDSMKKVEATREQRLQNSFARMSADEKQNVLQELKKLLLNKLLNN